MIIVTGYMPACMPKNRMHYQQKRAGRVGAGAVPLGDVIPNPAAALHSTIKGRAVMIGDMISDTTRAWSTTKQ